jgi:glycosyltransferase involved in cell wall biosynthesis
MAFLSFIVPAYNEAFEIAAALESIFSAARALGEPFEVIVVDDASTDETAALAKTAGAQVVPVQLRKISAARNAGARNAKGEWLFFVDADTRVSGTLIRAAARALQQGAVGGGAWVRFIEPVAWYVRPMVGVFNAIYMGIARWAAGCFVFAERNAFEKAGGFDETLYAGEEIFLSRALKRQGRFVIVGENVRTSSRKLRTRSLAGMLPLLFQFLRHGPAFLRQRQGMDWWYDGKREK